MITLHKVAKKYGQVKAVTDVSFSLKTGKTTALVGPNGAGKTSLLNMLSGLAAPDSGSIHYDTAKKDPRTQLGFLPQYPAFHDWMTAEEFLQFAARLGKKSKKEARIRSSELLELVGLADASRKKIGGFSGGMKQRLGIAQALVHEPKLLLLDEPVSALDPIGRKEIMILLNELKERMTILYSTHVLHDAQLLCDDVLMMNKGKMILFDSLHHIYQQYDKPRMVITFEHSFMPWVADMRQRYSGWEIQIKGNEVEVIGSNLGDLRRILLDEISRSDLPVRSITFGTSTLEEVFHEVMHHE
ncbi:ABC transporter ATP-binding protein [Jeotgalibacillus sp. ET6]|uniref:ABC transporter ATP-binding protein n=1 Tax=Jeotgalibacillus sp. ET6 TaxID=3037260 RepID=UPI0024183795|nr:ABC transporter ATP-binding protein [Jeotgalibacillus sp. ET6]MDG5473854.1 ABC transporter ATP-binding protein [Jeotgalibacillus sp. ET6]